MGPCRSPGPWRPDERRTAAPLPAGDPGPTPCRGIGALVTAPAAPLVVPPSPAQPTQAPAPAPSVSVTDRPAPGNGRARDYPVVLDLVGRPCLVVGGGPVAAAPRHAGLLDAGRQGHRGGPPRSAPAIEALLVRRRPRRRRTSSSAPTAPARPAGYVLVVTATGDPAIDGQVIADAWPPGCWWPGPTAAAPGPVRLPAVLRQGPVTVAVSTGGSSPALARWLRDRIAGSVPADVADDGRPARRGPSPPAGLGSHDRLGGLGHRPRRQLVPLVEAGRIDEARAAPGPALRRPARLTPDPPVAPGTLGRVHAHDPRVRAHPRRDRPLGPGVLGAPVERARRGRSPCCGASGPWPSSRSRTPPDLGTGPATRARVPGRHPPRRRDRDQPAPRDLLLGPGCGQHPRPPAGDGRVLRRHDLHRQPPARPAPAHRLGGLQPPTDPASIEESIEEVADRVIERAAGLGECDFVTEIAAPLPLEIICDMMGVPALRVRHRLPLLQRHPAATATPSTSPRATDPVLAIIERRPGAHRPDDRAQPPPDRPSDRRPDHRAHHHQHRRRGPDLRRAGLLLHPAADRRQRDDPQRHLPRAAGPDRASRPAGPVAGRPHRRRRPPAWTRSCGGPPRSSGCGGPSPRTPCWRARSSTTATRCCSSTTRPTGTRRCSRIPTPSTCCATPTPTSGSAPPGPTSAWGPTWPGGRST